ncbi:MAG: MNIO family bufferin maturase [Gammaproteobacteria bacterium]
MRRARTASRRAPEPVPAQAGIGLRPPHYEQILVERPALPFIEVHSENFFCTGGPALRTLEAVRNEYPVSLHGVGLSLGSADPLDRVHLGHLKALAERIDPALVSEHLCWCAIGGAHLNDLLPLPYTEEALAHVGKRVCEAQEFLDRRILVENVSSYLEFTDSTIPEWEFLAELAARTGCGILFDVNNVYVNAVNHGFDPYCYVDAMPAAAVGEIHLAGFTRKDPQGVPLLIDSHNRPVAEPVWALYAYALSRLGPKPTLIEWDRDIPPLATLLGEAAHAGRLLEELHAWAA